mmetsp:Transcript_17457/g.19464  ORF Transcript_17457/g.19464 Transcript_17457/m.19464 type:complete len:126 (-) Transcript_17457:132-509(-)
MLFLSFLGRLFLPCCYCCCNGRKNEDDDLSKESSTTISTSEIAKDDFHFLENSHKMYVDVVNLSPKFFRHFSRDAYQKGMHQRAQTIDGVTNSINEAIMYVVVKECTPEKHLKEALEALDKDRTV